jgi:cytochrome P450
VYAVVAVVTSVKTRSSRAPWIGSAAPKGGLLGLLPELNRDALGLLTQLTRRYGDLVRVRIGLTPIAVVGHPDLVEEVLVTRNHDYRKGQSTRRLGSLLGKGLLLSEGDLWLRQRRLMQPAFHRQRLTMMAEDMLAAGKDLVNSWHDGEVRAINVEMMEVTLRIVGRTLFGSDVSEDLSRIRRSSLVFNEHFRSRLYSLLTLLPDNFPTPGNLRYRRALHDLYDLIFRIARERRASDDPGTDLLGMLLSARDDTGRGMTDRQLRDEMVTLLLAGHDTTALTLTWAWALLARDTQVEQRLHASIRSVLGQRPPTVADVPALKYAEHVITETLRLCPTAWLIGREALCDTEIGGQRVPKGTTVLMAPWVLHRDPRFFDEPEAFRPERWADGLAERLPHFAYMPFGGGQRVCIGASFALLEATLLLTLIAQRFRLELVDPSRAVEPWPVVTLRTRCDLPMRISQRSMDHPA